MYFLFCRVFTIGSFVVLSNQVRSPGNKPTVNSYNARVAEGTPYPATRRHPAQSPLESQPEACSLASRYPLSTSLEAVSRYSLRAVPDFGSSSESEEVDYKERRGKVAARRHSTYNSLRGDQNNSSRLRSSILEERTALANTGNSTRERRHSAIPGLAFTGSEQSGPSIDLIRWSPVRWTWRVRCRCCELYPMVGSCCEGSFDEVLEFWRGHDIPHVIKVLYIRCSGSSQSPNGGMLV